MSWLAATLSVLVAFLLASAALHKLLAPERLGQATAGLTGLPLRTARPLMFGVAMAEGAAALAALIPSLRPAGLLAAASLWGVYTILLAAAFHRGGLADCGCTLAPTSRPLSAGAVLRAAALASLALVTALLPAAPGPPLDAPFAGAALFALFLAAGEILAVRHPPRSRPT